MCLAIKKTEKHYRDCYEYLQHHLHLLTLIPLTDLQNK